MSVWGSYDPLIYIYPVFLSLVKTVIGHTSSSKNNPSSLLEEFII